MGFFSIDHPAWIEIDLAQFRKNLMAIKRLIAGRLLCLPVKANAYGHGLIAISLAAQDAGVDMIAVSCLKEGVALRQAKLHCPILVFGAIHEEQIDALIDHNLEFSISSIFKAQLVAKKCRGRICRVHLEVDTGMRRTGVRVETALRLFDEVNKLGCFHIAGIYSHLAMADSPGNLFTMAQIESLASLKEKIGKSGILWHLANSGGVCYYPDSYFDMVRPGLLCYGLAPDGCEFLNIRPFFSLRARISYFKVVAAEQGISYGHAYRTKAQTRIITVPVGYGDGYARGLSNCTEVLVRGKRYSIAGNICMDQFMVDIGSDEAFVGEEVTLIGRQKDQEISVWDLARQLNTDPRDIFCRFNDRLPRVYSRCKSSL